MPALRPAVVDGLFYPAAAPALRVEIDALLARRHGLRARLLDLRNSGDTAGDRRRVVGYGAITFEEGAG